jgi:REP element-mobilizing transposase RayT
MEDIKPIAYALRFNTVNSLDIFVRKSFKDLVIDTLINIKKDFEVTFNGYIVMSDHVSVVVTPDSHRDIKMFYEKLKYSLSQKVMSVLESNSLMDKRWLLFLVNFINKDNSEAGGNKIWCLDNPIQPLYSEDDLNEKLLSLYNEPVEEGLVSKPEEYVYSSCKENFVEQLVLDRQAV